MLQFLSNADIGGAGPIVEDPRAYLSSLSAEEVQLLVLRDELYDGSWDEMKRDLEDRRDGKPFIFKLVNRIDEDLARIEQLAGFEDKHGVNLSDFLDAEE